MSTEVFVAVSFVLLFLLASSILVSVIAFCMAAWSWKTPSSRNRRLKQALASLLVAGTAYGGAVVLASFLDLSPQEPTESDWKRLRVAMDDNAAEASRITLGDPAPKFSTQTLDGLPFEFLGATGSVTVVNFFRTDCGPCLLELPVLQEAYARYGERSDFRIIALGRGESEQTLRKFRDERNLTLPIAADSDASIYRLYASESVPRTYLIGRDGSVVFQFRGFIQNDQYDGDREIMLNAVEKALGVDAGRSEQTPRI